MTRGEHAAITGAVSRVEIYLGDKPKALESCHTQERASEVLEQDLSCRITSQLSGGMKMLQEFRFIEDADYFLVRVGLETPAGSDALPVMNLKPLHVQHGGGLRLGASALSWSVYQLGFQSWSPAGAVLVHKHQPKPRFKIPRIMSYNPGRRTPRTRGRHLCDWLGVIKNTNTGESLICGFVTMRDFLSHIYLRVDAGTGDLLRFNAHCDADRVPLAPGRTLFSEWLMVGLPGRVLDGMATYAEVVQREMNARVPEKIPVGWCSWYKYFTGITQEQMESNLKHVARLAGDIPISVFQLDDGYQKAVGDWTSLIRDKFPDDLTKLARKISEQDLIPGIWTAPFFARTNSRLYAEHKDWFIHDRKGGVVSAGFNPLWGGEVAPLDLTHPQVRQWLHDLFHQIVHEWGFKFLKLDFLYSSVVKGRLYDQSKTRAQAYREGLEIIREAAGEDVLILGCGAPLGPAVGLVDIMRIGADVGPKWRDTVFRAAVGDRTEPSVESSLINCVTRSFLHKKFWLNDPDCVLLRKGNLTADEYRTFASVVGLTGGMLLISDDMAELDREGMDVFKSLVPPSGTPALAVDLFEHEYPSVFAARFDAALPRTVAAAVNWKDESGRVTVDFGAMGLSADAEYLVYNFWDKKFLGVLNTDITFFRMPAHGCKLLSLVEYREEPAVLGTDLHITCGGLELARHDYDASARKMNLELQLPGRRAGHVFVYVPDELSATNINADGGTANMKKHARNVVSVNVEFTDGMTLELEF